MPMLNRRRDRREQRARSALVISSHATRSHARDNRVTATMVRIWAVRLHVLDLRGMSERHSDTDTATKTVDV
jgi:hypothetical protein